LVFIWVLLFSRLAAAKFDSQTSFFRSFGAAVSFFKISRRFYAKPDSSPSSYLAPESAGVICPKKYWSWRFMVKFLTLAFIAPVSRRNGENF